MVTRAYLGSDLPEDQLLVPTQGTPPPRPPPPAFTTPPGLSDEPSGMRRYLQLRRDRRIDRLAAEEAEATGETRLSPHTGMGEEYERVIEAARQNGVTIPTDRAPTRQEWRNILRGAGTSRMAGFGGDNDTLLMMEIARAIGDVDRYTADQYATGGGRVNPAFIDIHPDLPPAAGAFSFNDIRRLVEGSGRFSPRMLDELASDSPGYFQPAPRLEAVLEEAIRQVTTPEQAEAIRNWARQRGIRVPSGATDLREPVGKVGDPTLYFKEQREEERRNPRRRPEPKIYYPPDREIEFRPDRQP